MSIVIVALLIIFPAVSWYYLQTGLDHRKKTLSELNELGQIGPFQLRDQSNRIVSQEGLKGKVAVVNFLPADRDQAKALTGRIAKVHQSFSREFGIAFLSFIPQDSTRQIIDVAKELGIENPEQWSLLSTPVQEWQRLAEETFRLPKPGSSVALVDSTGMIRNYYDINNNQEMGRLVEQSVLIMPKKKKR